MNELLVFNIIVIGAMLNAAFDSKQIKKGNYIYELGHASRMVVRSIVLFFLVFFLVPDLNLYQFISLYLFYGAGFWIIFDALMNINLGFKITRIGSTAKTDRFMQRFGENYAFQIKIVIFLTLNCIYLLI